jgi:flagellar hook-associated protein 1 FlgK
MPLSLNGITAAAVSALKTNSAALGVVSSNVANLNTPGYARRVVNLSTLSAGGQLMGVDIASIQRIASQFLDQEVLSAGGSAAQYDTEADLFSQLNGLLGAPGDNQSLATQFTNMASAFATASQAPTASASRTGVTNALGNLAASFSNVFGTITALQSQIDQQVSGSISSTNALIRQVYDLNQQIRTATAAGDKASGLLDQRDVALQSLSQTLGIRATPQADGSVAVSTQDGLNLVSNTYAVLSYSGSAGNGSYGNIAIQDVNPQTGQTIGAPQALDPHLGGGSLKGMIDMRDNVLGGLAETLGALAQQTAQAVNQQSNANAAHPPPSTLSGRDTGLIGTDALNFSGKTTLAVTSATGQLVSRVDIDFTAGTLSVDGGTSASLGGTVASFTAALNTALGARGTASFANGSLSLTASGGNGLALKDDDAAPSSRGGAGFSQFFGLNDVFTASAPSITATGLSAADASGLAAGGKIALNLKGPDGDIVKQVSITTSAGQTIGDVVNALNTALGGAATLTLGSDGALSIANSALYPGYRLGVTTDTSVRGTTGMSFTQIFGLGQTARQAAGFALTPALAANPARLGFGAPQITAATVAGDTILSAGDNSGALALQNIITQKRSFAGAGGLAAQVASLSDYAAGFYQNVATQSNNVTTGQTSQDDRLSEAKQRQSSNAGVNLDEELTALSSYQQAYAAGARILSVVDQLYQTLLEIQ